jgi:hypothetical protein
MLTPWLPMVCVCYFSSMDFAKYPTAPLPHRLST